MAVQMIGIAHEMADLKARELFSFHMHEAKEAMHQLMRAYDLLGCVIISTCNRTEIYISTDEKRNDLVEILCQLKGVSPKAYEGMFILREDDEAYRHLFLLACGMKSKIYGEDQIITQVKTALTWAREEQVTDVVLEKLFQAAITAAKKVKTKVHLTSVQTSVIERMLQVAKEQWRNLEGLNCLVIGNGEIGRLAATRLIGEGAKVTMTLRQYKTKEVQIPAGCKIIDYKARYEHLQDFELIISGTSSPHHTLKYEEGGELLADGKVRLIVDLAVPRDVSSKFAQLDEVKLYNIDDLGGMTKEAVNEVAVQEATEIVNQYLEEFKSWNNFREYVPMIQAVGHAAGLDVYKRLEKKVKKQIDVSQEEEVEQAIRQAADKVVSAMLFGLKDYLPQEEWQDTLKAIELIMLQKAE